MAEKLIYDDDGNPHWIDIGDLGAKIGNSGGNTTRDIQRFIKSMGYKPTSANVELIRAEVTRTQSQNETVGRVAKETGQDGAYDSKGKVTHERINKVVSAEQEARAERGDTD